MRRLLAVFLLGTAVLRRVDAFRPPVTVVQHPPAPAKALIHQLHPQRSRSFSRAFGAPLRRSSLLPYCPTCTSSTRLFSLLRLIETVKQSNEPSTIFVGGKGGVGKTTVSAALAVHLAEQTDLKVLIVSTDPAHSLGDALDHNMRPYNGAPFCLSDRALTRGRLYAQEVDAATAMADFRETLSAFDVAKLADALNVNRDLLESLGLSEFSGLLNNPPPGLDELVALSNVFQNDESFDVVVVDTAPTGHTLRLLALPQFLDGLLGKLIQLRLKLAGIASTLQAFLGSAEANQRAAAIDNAVNRLEQFKAKMSRLRSNLQNAATTRFVVVTVPTILSVAESKRLVTELQSQSVSVTDVVVNQCVAATEDDTALQKYYDRRVTGQQTWIGKLRQAVQKVSDSSEFQQNGSAAPIAITQVPFFDVELVGVPALGYVGSQVYTGNPSYAHLLTDRRAADAPPKVVICGGKGGVGKTTTSASLAVTMAAAGHKVALISTDPAHSLGDAVSMDLRGGKLQECVLIGVPNNSGDGSLSLLEVDPAASIKQFKGVVDQLMGKDRGAAADAKGGIRDTLSDLQEIFDTLPAGTDEVVALAEIVNLVKKGGFDRIVLDTAPTGHTLRMLSTPGFLSDLIDRLLRISEKINSNSVVKLFLGGSARREEIKTAVENAKSTLLSFQFRMYDLEDLFSDAENTEFLIVSVPTELAVRESIRLLNDLTFESPETPIKVRNVVINQVLKDGDEDDAKNFVSHVASTQTAAILDLEQFLASVPDNPAITKVPYLDTEPRGVFGLKALAVELIRQAEVVEA